MLSDKVKRLLHKYEIEETSDLTEQQAWALIAQRSRAKRTPKPAVSVCFSGFTATVKDELVLKAKNAGFRVNSTVAKSTTHLCCDMEHVGPSKLAKAEQQEVRIVDEDEFRHMLETGEIL